MSGTGIDAVPNLLKYPVSVLMSYRPYRNVRYGYWRRTELTKVSGTGNTGGIYRRYTSVRTVPNTPLDNLICTLAHQSIGNNNCEKNVENDHEKRRKR